MFAAPYDPALAPSFATAYRAQWNAEPNVFSALAHDAYGLIKAALSTGAVTRDSVANALHTVRVTNPVSAVGALNTSPAAAPVRLESLIDQTFQPLAQSKR